MGGSDRVRIGALEALRVDERPAWGWLETRLAEAGTPRSLEFTALVSYDTVHFVLAFSTDFPERMDPDEMRAVVASFGEGRTVLLWRTIVAAFVLLTGTLGYLHGRSRRRPPEYRLPEYPGSELDGAPDPSPAAPYAPIASDPGGTTLDDVGAALAQGSRSPQPDGATAPGPGAREGDAPPAAPRPKPEP